MTEDQPHDPISLTSDERAQALDKFRTLYEALGKLVARTAESLPPDAREREPLDSVGRRLETMSRFRQELLQEPDVIDGLMTLQKEMGKLLDSICASLAPDAPQREVIHYIRENLETTSGLQQRLLRMSTTDSPNAKD